MRISKSLLVLLCVLLITGCDSTDEPTFENKGPISITVDDTYLNEDMGGWIFTTNSAGVVQVVKEFHNGDVLRFDTNGPNSGITIMTYTKDNDLNQDRSTVRTYQNVDSLNLLLKRFEPLPFPNVVGTHTAIINNVSPPYQYPGVEVIDGRWGSSVSYNPSNATAQMATKLYQSSAKVIYTLQTSFDELLKYEVANAQAGATVELNAADFTPFDYYPMQFDNSDGAVADVYYMKKPGDYGGFYYFGASIVNLETHDELKVEYPNLDAPEFFTSIRWDCPDDLNYRYSLIADHVAQEYKQINASITDIEASETQVSFTGTGDADVVNVASESFVTEMVCYWTIYDKRSTRNVFPIPKLPGKILSRYPKLRNYDFDFTVAEMEDAVGINDYRDWIESSRYSNEHFYSKVKERKHVYQYFYNLVNGKKKNGHKSTDINSLIIDR